MARLDRRNFSVEILLVSIMNDYHQGTQRHGTGKTEKMAHKILSGKTQRIWKFCRNTVNFVKTQGKRREFCNVSSSCKCSDSKSKGHCDIC